MKNTPGTLYKLPVLVVSALLAMNAQAQITKVVNAASFVSNTSLTPGSIVSVFGTKLAAATAYASDPNNLPTTLAGVTVTAGNRDCVLFYVSPTQINARIDPGADLGPTAVTVTSPFGASSVDVTLEKAGAPGLFSFSSTGTRDGAVLNGITFARGPFSATTGGGPTWLALYATGLDLSTAPGVTIGGVPVLVEYYGPAPGFEGLQQINVQLPASLAGAGRVEVAVTAGGKTSNIVEIVILPAQNQGPFPPQAEHQMRNRELASIAYVPGTGLALLTDENDDVVRVIDVERRAVVRTMTLPEGAEPVAVAARDNMLAVVAERDLARIAVLDLAAWKVTEEIEVPKGPSYVAIAGNVAVVISQDQDAVALVDLVSKETELVAVGRGPRYVSIDGNFAYVTNQDEGTVSEIDLAIPAVTRTFILDPNARPFAIQVVPAAAAAIITEPSAHRDGRAWLLDLVTGDTTRFDANPERSGGSSDIALWESTVYFANQTGGSVTMAAVPTGTVVSIIRTVKVDIGARALAVDPDDGLLLVTNQGSGTIVLIDLETGAIAGRINGVRGEAEDDEEIHDNRDDRERAANRPVINTLSPASSKAGVSFTLTVTGTNLSAATDMWFVIPDTLPGNGHGKGHSKDKNGNNGNHGHGPFGVRDAAFAVSNVVSNAAGTQLTATVTIAANAAKGDRVVRVVTPNGESSFVMSAANTFKVE